jgi:hypothetical protein
MVRCSPPFFVTTIVYPEGSTMGAIAVNAGYEVDRGSWLPGGSICFLDLKIVIAPNED